jgi:hypothetical protein
MPRNTALLLILMMSAACAVNTRPTVEPDRMAEFWAEPADVRSRNLFEGAGGARLAPDPQGRYSLIEVDDTGFSPGYDVKDEAGRIWSVKLGPEARTEVVVSRILWAMGYHQPPVYYLPRWTLVDKGATRTEPQARFRLESGREDVGDWSWRNNPFLDTQPFAGLFVLMVIVNNWDLKSQQNAIYEVSGNGGGPGVQYVIKDLGASFGKTSWWLPGNRDEIEDFEKEPFITGVSKNRVQFAFRGAWLEPQLIDSVTPADVRWICDRLARLSPQQWLDAFRAGGYTEAEASRFIRRLQEKIGQGLELGSPATARSTSALSTTAR